MPLTKQEKQAKWPVRFDKFADSTWWYVHRKGLGDRWDLLAIRPSLAAAIYAIAKTQE